MHPSPQAICSSTSAQPLVLASLEPVSDVTLAVYAPDGVRPPEFQGVMVVDGVVTSAQWPENAPIVYALPDGRRLLYDAYNEDRAYIWERDAKRLTDLGRVGLVAAGSRGRFVVRYDGADQHVYSDIAADKPALRDVWRVPPEHNAKLVGEVDGIPVGLEIPAHWTKTGQQRESPHVKLVCIDGELNKKHSITLPPGFDVDTNDAIRGHRLLMLGRRESKQDSTWMVPFNVDVWILDLDRRKPRKLGTVAGSYTHGTAVPHPYVNVEWADTPLVKRGRLGGDDVTYFVDPATEAVK